MTHDELASELAETIRELGEARAGAIMARREAWNGTMHLPVTERREETRAHTAQLDAEVVKLEADVEALRVELAAELRKVEDQKLAELLR